MDTEVKLSQNSLAFIALCNVYCQTVNSASESSPEDFVAAMTRQLPRIYIAAEDLKTEAEDEDYAYIDDVLDEDQYNALRASLEGVLGENDTYLEVFEEDMKYSDTPIGASISEGLCDIYQVLFNFLESVRDNTNEGINAVLALVKDDFEHYWSRILCNVLRALNHIRYNC